MGDKLELLNEIRGYLHNDLRESDVRYRVIDNLFKRVLDWPDEKVKTEDHVHSGFIDYTLCNKNSVPVLLIEAKREGKYFEIPNNVNNRDHIRLVPTDQLLSNKDINDALFQVKEYADDLGCSYVCITNGDQWIFSHVNPVNNKSWKKQKSIVITEFEYFVSSFTDAFNFLSYHSITEEASLSRRLIASRNQKGESFWPKNQISSYNATVTNNQYANIFNLIARKYLSTIPLDDADFMRRCYVTDKGYHDALQKNVRGFIYDTLTPYFKNLGVKEFKDDKKGGAFGYRIQEILRRQNLNSVMILFGGRGSGKSTFIERFLYYVKPSEVANYSVTCIVNLIDSAQNKTDLTNEIWRNILDKVDLKGKLKSGQEVLLELFKSEFEIYENQFLINYSDSSEARQSLISKFLLEKLDDTKYCCQKLALDWNNASKGLIIVLDNLDQLTPELQDVCFLTAVEVSSKLNCLVIISMREERYFNAKSRGTLDAYHTNGFHIPSPIITQVLVKRINYILDKIRVSTDLESEFDIRSDRQLEVVNKFLKICSRGLNNDTSDFSEFIRVSTHGDVRKALGFFKSFLTSGYTNINEMTAKGFWSFKKHQILKPVMIPERFFYDELYSDIPNIYRVRDERNGSHFTGLRILSLLDHQSNDNVRSGFSDCSHIIQIFENKFNMKRDCELNLNILLQKGYIESNNRLDEFTTFVDKVRITASGKYLLDFLFKDFTYLDLVCIDTPVYSDRINNELVSHAKEEFDLFHKSLLYERIIVRLDKTEKFIQYLKEFENEELENLNLLSSEKVFSSIIEAHFDEEKEAVLRSAKANT
jgi:hypothetical protein